MREEGKGGGRWAWWVEEGRKGREGALLRHTQREGRMEGRRKGGREKVVPRLSFMLD